jgi:hypothetical protein
MARYRNFNTGGMPEKIIASANYHEMIVEKLHSGVTGRQIARSGAGIVDKYFGLWLDNKARRSPEKYHHLYEWGKTGDRNSRLFECKISNNSDPVINFYFKQSTQPNEDGYVFSNKAEVMENGDPVTISPTDSDVLSFEVDGEVIFTPNEVHVDNPGGTEVQGSFQEAFHEFMSYEAERSLDAMGFTSTILNGIKSESDRTLSKMSGDRPINPTQESNISSQNIARMIEVIENEL